MAILTDRELELNAQRLRNLAETAEPDQAARMRLTADRFEKLLQLRRVRAQARASRSLS